jgi:hypothetical protein
MSAVEQLRPQHDAPPCPQCSLTVATPAAVRLAVPFRFVFRHGLRELWCPACGHMWSEEDDEAVAKAWWAGGAYAGAEDAAHRRGGAR